MVFEISTQWLVAFCSTQCGTWFIFLYSHMLMNAYTLTQHVTCAHPPLHTFPLTCIILFYQDSLEEGVNSLGTSIANVVVSGTSDTSA